VTKYTREHPSSSADTNLLNTLSAERAQRVNGYVGAITQ
jgi:hypothetical protein